MFPDTREQRCWFHKTGNDLTASPKSATGAKALAEIYDAEDRDTRDSRGKGVRDQYGPKWPKAAAKITDDLDVLLDVRRLPGRALGPPADDEPDRADVRHRAATPTGDQRAGLTGGRDRDGVQTPRVRPTPVASRQRVVAASQIRFDLYGSEG